MEKSDLLQKQIILSRIKAITNYFGIIGIGKHFVKPAIARKQIEKKMIEKLEIATIDIPTLFKDRIIEQTENDLVVRLFFKDVDGYWHQCDKRIGKHEIKAMQ